MTEDPVVRASLRDIENKIGRLESSVTSLIASVNRTASLQSALQAELSTFHRKVADYITADAVAQHKLFAQAALLDVGARLDREFGHHEAVRRSALGMLQAMDAGTAAHGTLHQAAEQLAIDAPGYWLAPALVALAAWARDSEPDAKRAVRDATNRDLGKSALFFCLVMARWARRDTATEWISTYLRELGHWSLSWEFAFALDAIERGALGEGARVHLRTTCLGWYDKLRSWPGLAGRQVTSWRSFIKSQGKGQGQALAREFDLLPQVSTQPGWNDKLGWLEAAAAFGNTEEWLRERIAAPGAQGEGAVPAIDGLLRHLVAVHDKDEARLLRRASALQAVIDGGSSARDMPAVARETAEPVDQDFLTLLTDIALDRLDITFSPLTTKSALILSGTFIEQAISELRRRSEDSRPASIEIDIDGWQHAIAPGDDAKELAGEYEKFAEREAQKAVEDIRGLWARRRRDDVRNSWQAHQVAGIEKVHRIVTDVNKFFARWHKEIASAGRCIELIGAESAGAARESAKAASPESVADATPADDRTDDRTDNRTDSLLDTQPGPFALKPPDWDLLPPSTV